MDNNYEFWETYLTKTKKAIKEICKTKDKIFIDMHIHSNYSADGSQTIKQIIETTNKKGFDIISITDHDILDAYDEIYKYVKNGITTPIIVPGIEFTTDNATYGNQCHILQLFINPKDPILLKEVKKNYEAAFKRSKIQFKRLKQNKAIQKISKEKHLKVSYYEYLKYIKNNKLLPEYNTLSEYLMYKFKKKKIKTFDIFNYLQFYNNLDCYDDRKNFKLKRYAKLKEKYPYSKDNYYNSNLLLSMLAVREVDDDWWDYPSSGSLSVNSYGQLKIEDLDMSHMTFFAHPTESKLDVVDKIIKENSKIIGLEQNIRNNYTDINNFNNIIKKNKLYRIIGSDSHDSSMQFYQDMKYYEINSKEFISILGDINGKN